MQIRSLTRALSVSVAFWVLGWPSGRAAPADTNQWQRPFGGNFGASISYSAPSPIAHGSRGLGDLSTVSTRVNYAAVFRSSPTYAWYVGADFSGLFADAPADAPIPESLYGVALDVGNRWQFHPRWHLETRLSPGFYSDFADLDGHDFNLPAFAMLSHEFNEKLTGIFGLAVNVRRDIPVIPGLGVNWRFARQWNLRLVFPVPRLQYNLNEQWSAHLGVEFMRPAYRVGQDFGTRRGRPELDDQMVTYQEWRIGGGLAWQFYRGLNATLDAGWMVDRRFHFEDRDLMLNGDGAPYVKLGIGGRY